MRGLTGAVPVNEMEPFTEADPNAVVAADAAGAGELAAGSDVEPPPQPTNKMAADEINANVRTSERMIWDNW